MYLDAAMLRDIVNREIHPIRCASTCGRKALKGLMLGDLCAEARHPRWALKIWMFVIELIHDKDYEDWVGVWFNPRYVSFQDVISNGLCEILGRRIDDLNRRHGWARPEGRDCWEYWAGDGWYDGFRYEKFDSDWDAVRDYYIEMRNTAVERQREERFFHDVQGELPPQSQNFFDYWSDYDPLAQEDFYFKVDDWD